MEEQTPFPLVAGAGDIHSLPKVTPDRKGFRNLWLRTWADRGELLLWKEVIDARSGSGGVVGVGARLSWQLFFLFPWLQDDNLET